MFITFKDRTVHVLIEGPPSVNGFAECAEAVAAAELAAVTRKLAVPTLIVASEQNGATSVSAPNANFRITKEIFRARIDAEKPVSSSSQTR